MDKLHVVLKAMIELFRVAKKQPLVCILLLITIAASFKEEAYILLDYYGIKKYETQIPLSDNNKLSQLMLDTGSNVASQWKFNYVVPQTMSEVIHVSNGVNIEHIKKTSIPIKEHAEMIVDLYSDECFDGGLSSDSGFSEYITQGVKHIVACPIKGDDQTLVGFTIVMFTVCPANIEAVMTAITKFNRNL